MIRDREKGLISIFLAIILIPSYMLSIASMDMSRIYAGKNYLRLANEAALTSILLNYDKSLYDKYKLLAVTDMNKAGEISKKIVESSLASEDENENFHKFSKAEINLNPLSGHKLLNEEELERQILDYMQYKGPLDLLNGFIDILDSLKNAKEYNEILEKKINYNKKLENININIRGLSENSIKYKDSLEKIDKSLNSFFKDYYSLKIEIENLEKTIEKIKKKQPESKGEQELIKEGLDKIRILGSKFVDKYSGLEPAIKDLLILAVNLRDDLDGLQEKTQGLQESLDDWQKSIEEISSSDIKRQFKSEYIFSDKSFSKENISSMIEILDINKKNLEKFLDLIFSEGGQIQILKLTPQDFLIKSLDEKTLNSISLRSIKDSKILNRFSKESKKIVVDKKKKADAKNLKALLENFNKQNHLEKYVEESIFDYISQEDYKYIVDFKEEKGGIDPEASDIKKNKQIFSTYNFSYDFSSKQIINNFFIAQYIADKFSDKTIDLGDQIMSQKEYILFGGDKLDDNLRKARDLIFAMRLSLNAMYAFTSPDVRKDALSLATAIAGWSGIGVFLLEAVLLSSMSLGETILDVGKLSEGKDIGIFKNKSSWTFSLEGIGRLAQENALNFAKNSLENIMDSLEQIVIEAEDKSFESLNNFISQTSNGIVQSVTGSILIPIQNTLVDLINENKKDYVKNIEDLFEKLSTGLQNSANDSVAKLLGEIIDYLENNYKQKMVEILSEKSTLNNDHILQVIDEMNNKANEMVQDFNEKLADQLRGQITSIVNEKTATYRTRIRDAINSYLAKYAPKESEKIGQFAKSGLSLSYSDYLKLLTFIKLNGPQRPKILKRMLLVVDIELKSKNKEFSIKEAWTGFRVNSKANIPMIIDVFANKDRKRMVEDELEITFER
ncbi:MAG: DUF5702 domain-containing protein [Tissierellia bacterium]|nr:DUF5702 domain-containing protein [Tissierellia bacterium]